MIVKFNFHQIVQLPLMDVIRNTLTESFFFRTGTTCVKGTNPGRDTLA